MQSSYDILGVSPSASDEEIKTAYRKMAKKYHPDLHPSDAQASARMNQINAAYQDILNQRSGSASYTQQQWRDQAQKDQAYYHDWQDAYGSGQQNSAPRSRRGGFWGVLAAIAAVNILLSLFGRSLPFFFFFI